MTAEAALVATAVQAWKMNLERAEKHFSALSETQLLGEIVPGKNRQIYLFGHLLAVHDAMLPLLGIGPRLHPELDAPFLTEADKSVGELPSGAELKRLWSEVHERLHAGFDRFTASDWVGRHTVVSEADFAANPLRNRLAVLLSRTAHIAYHLGQCALAPK